MFETELGDLNLKKNQAARLGGLATDWVSSFTSRNGVLTVRTIRPISKIEAEGLIEKIKALSAEPMPIEAASTEFKKNPLAGFSPEEAEKWAKEQSKTPEGMVDTLSKLAAAVVTLAKKTGLTR